MLMTGLYFVLPSVLPFCSLCSLCLLSRRILPDALQAASPPNGFFCILPIRSPTGGAFTCAFSISPNGAACGNTSWLVALLPPNWSCSISSLPVLAASLGPPFPRFSLRLARSPQFSFLPQVRRFPPGSGKCLFFLSLVVGDSLSLFIYFLHFQVLSCSAQNYLVFTHHRPW